MRISQEFADLRHQLLNAGIELRELRPFAVPHDDVYAICFETGTDQPVPAPGASFEYMGINCVCVANGR